MSEKTDKEIRLKYGIESPVDRWARIALEELKRETDREILTNLVKLLEQEKKGSQ